jgi:hypothetical protein
MARNEQRGKNGDDDVRRSRGLLGGGLDADAHPQDRRQARGDAAILTLPNGTTRKVPLKPGVFPFLGMVGLNLYTRFYDEAKGGKQVLPILISHKKAD